MSKSQKKKIDERCYYLANREFSFRDKKIRDAQILISWENREAEDISINDKTYKKINESSTKRNDEKSNIKNKKKSYDKNKKKDKKKIGFISGNYRIKFEKLFNLPIKFSNKIIKIRDIIPHDNSLNLIKIAERKDGLRDKYLKLKDFRENALRLDSKIQRFWNDFDINAKLRQYISLNNTLKDISLIEKSDLDISEIADLINKVMYENDDITIKDEQICPTINDLRKSNSKYNKKKRDSIEALLATRKSRIFYRTQLYTIRSQIESECQNIIREIKQNPSITQFFEKECNKNLYDIHSDFMNGPQKDATLITCRKLIYFIKRWKSYEELIKEIRIPFKIISKFLNILDDILWDKKHSKENLSEIEKRKKYRPLFSKTIRFLFGLFSLCGIITFIFLYTLLPLSHPQYYVFPIIFGLINISYFYICVYAYSLNRLTSNWFNIYFTFSLFLTAILTFLSLGIIAWWVPYFITFINLSILFIWTRNFKKEGTYDCRKTIKNFLLIFIFIFFISYLPFCKFLFSEPKNGPNYNTLFLLIQIIITSIYTIKNNKFSEFRFPKYLFLFVSASIITISISLNYFGYRTISLWIMPVFILITEILMRERKKILKLLRDKEANAIQYHGRKKMALFYIILILLFVSIILYLIYPAFTMIPILCMSAPSVMLARHLRMKSKRKLKSHVKISKKVKKALDVENENVINNALEPEIRGKYQAFSVLALIFLILLPTIFGIQSLINIDMPKISFAKVDRVDRVESSAINLNSLTFGSYNNLGDLSINDMFIAKCESTLGISESSKMLFRLIPNKSLPNIVEDRVRQSYYDIRSCYLNGPLKNGNLFTYGELNKLDLIPGGYEMYVYYSEYSALSWKSSEPEVYDITLNKDDLHVIGIEELNNEEVNFGSVYTIDNGGNFTVYFDGKLVNSAGEALPHKEITLYIEKSNKWEELATVSTDEKGRFYYKTEIYSSFEINALAKIESQGNGLYNKMEFIEYAGLEISEDGEKFFPDANGDDLPDWGYSVYDLIKALTAPNPPPSWTSENHLSFMLEFNESSGINTYDNVNNYDGKLTNNPIRTWGIHGNSLYYNNSAHVEFGNILYDELNSSNQFTITSWIQPFELNSIENGNSIKNSFISKNGTIQFGINELGQLQVYLNTENVETIATYGSEGSIVIGDWNYIAIIFNESNIDVRINNEWYEIANGGIEEPWLNCGDLINNEEILGNLTVGSNSAGDSYFTGKLDDISIYEKAISRNDVEQHKGVEALIPQCNIFKEDGSGGWIDLDQSQELIDSYILFKTNMLSYQTAFVDSMEFYLSTAPPDIIQINDSLLHLIGGYYYDNESYALVKNSYELPDGEWYLVTKVQDYWKNRAYDYYNKSIRINHFDNVINFTYLDSIGKIGIDSEIAVIPHEDISEHISSLNLYINYSNNIDLLTTVNYSVLVENYFLMNLDSLEDWRDIYELDGKEINASFTIECNYSYGDAFPFYSFNYSLNETMIDFQAPFISLLLNQSYSLDLEKTYTDSSNYILTGAITPNSPDFSHFKLYYRYFTTESTQWSYYDTFQGGDSPINFTFNIWSLKDDQIEFMLKPFDFLENYREYYNESFRFVKDFNKNLYFELEGIDDTIIYGLDEEEKINLNITIRPYDNDITKVKVYTAYETFYLTTRYLTDNYIYFADLGNEIKLNGLYYNIFGGEFKEIPLNIELYQQNNLISSRKIIITSTDSTFSEVVNITDVSIDINSAQDNIWVNFEDLQNTYSNRDNVPYIVKNQIPTLTLYNEQDQLIRTVNLAPITDGSRTEVYDKDEIEILSNKFILPLPSNLLSEEAIITIDKVIINATEYQFYYFIDDSHLSIKIISGQLLDGQYGQSIPIEIYYSYTNSYRENNQYKGSLNFKNLPQGIYTAITKFTDISNEIILFTQTQSVDFSGPEIYAQFSDGISVNPNSGEISFILQDLSDIDNYYLNNSEINGYWTTTDNNEYIFHFNDTQILEGIHHIRLIAKDSLNQISSYEFSLILDRSPPILQNIYTNPQYWNGLFRIEFNIFDLSPYSITLKARNSSTGDIYSNLDISLIEDGSLTNVILDTNQLPNGLFDLIIGVTDFCGNEIELIIEDRYFDNSAPVLVDFMDNVYVDNEIVYSQSLDDIIYINDQEYINLTAYDELFDSFSWNCINTTIAEQMGIQNVYMHYTNTLSWYDVSIEGSLNYNKLLYKITGDIDKIIEIQKIRIDNRIVDEFNVYRENDELFIEFDEQYRYLLSPQNSYKIDALYYELIEEPLPLTFINEFSYWQILTSGYEYFNISHYLELDQGDELLIWFSIVDGIGQINGTVSNEYISSKYLCIYDNSLEFVGESLFSWFLGTTSFGEGILIAGSEDPSDSTIYINTTSIRLNYLEESDVDRIYLYCSNSSQTNFTYLGRGYWNEFGQWAYYWDVDSLDEIPIDTIYIKIILLDRAGNLLKEIRDLRIFDYSSVQLLADTIFGECISYDDKSNYNPVNFSGIIENFESPSELWDVIVQYYSPIEDQWINLAIESTTIMESGDYEVIWDINDDEFFLEQMRDFSYDYLPMKIGYLTGETIWGTWGKFGDNWQPILILDEGGKINIEVYQFDNSSGWLIDPEKSEEVDINCIESQSFKLFDVDQDNIPEIIRLSNGQIDVLYFGSSQWKCKSNITQLHDYQYFCYDIFQAPESSDSYLFVAQLDTSQEFTFWKYRFLSSFDVDVVKYETAPENFIPTMIKGVVNFGESDCNSILIGGLMHNSYSSQLFEFDLSLNYKDIISDYILGKISCIKHENINGIDTILIGVERLKIGKMDAVISLKYSSEQEEWISYEISGFDEIRFEIIDLLTITQNNYDKIIIASKTGLFESLIDYIEDVSTILSPICYVSETFGKKDLTPEQYPIIQLKHIQIKEINNIWYKSGGQWIKLDQAFYSNSYNQIRINLEDLWDDIQFIKISYSFLSFSDTKKAQIDPSFKIYNANPNAHSVSVSGTFLDISTLPLQWLNPGTSWYNPNADWRQFSTISGWNERGINYQYTPVISGIGSTVAYPQVQSGWNDDTSSEYFNMPELSNSLIDYGGDYGSAMLSESLMGYEEFEENNYIDGTWLSNPSLSESYNFSRMYYDSIHDASEEGIYNNYSGLQTLFVKNSLTEYNILADQFQSGIVPSGILPFNPAFSPQMGSEREIAYTLDDWDEYIALAMSDQDSVYGLEITNKLPLVDKEGLLDISLSFDASVISTASSYPLSLQIWNYYTDSWEALPISTVQNGKYILKELNYLFWTWQAPYHIDAFRPAWYTKNILSLNTVSFGNCVPMEITDDAIWFDEIIYDPYSGANFLKNNKNNEYSMNNYWSFEEDEGIDRHKVLFYDDLFNANRFQLNSIKINPHEFYTTGSNNFPAPTSQTQFTERDFFREFVNSEQEFKVRIITTKESDLPDEYLCIGDFKTYAQLSSNYLNYDNFENSNPEIMAEYEHFGEVEEWSYVINLNDPIINEASTFIEAENGRLFIMGYLPNFDGYFLYTSIDGGRTWSVIDFGLGSNTIFYDREEENIYYGAGGVYNYSIYGGDPISVSNYNANVDIYKDQNQHFTVRAYKSSGIVKGWLQFRSIEDEDREGRQDMGPASGRTFSTSRTCTANNGFTYILWQWSDGKVELWANDNKDEEYHDLTRLLWSQIDFGENMMIPSNINLRTLNYDGDETISFILKDMTDGKHYFYSYNIDDDEYKRIRESNVIFTRDSNILDENGYNIGFDMETNEIFQMRKYNNYYKIATPQIDEGDQIVTISENYIITEDDKVYKLKAPYQKRSHINDGIQLTSDGLMLSGDSGFNIKENPPLIKFQDNLYSPWQFEGTDGTFIYSTYAASDTYVSSEYSLENFGDSQTLKVQGNFDYSGDFYSVDEDGIERTKDIAFDGEFYWVLAGDYVYKYDSNGNYLNKNQDISLWDGIPICIDMGVDNYWGWKYCWVIETDSYGNTLFASRLKMEGDYWDYDIVQIFHEEPPWGYHDIKDIYYNSPYLYILVDDNVIYKLVEVSNQENFPPNDLIYTQEKIILQNENADCFWTDGAHWFASESNFIYIYDLEGNYLDYNFELSPIISSPEGVCFDGRYIWMLENGIIGFVYKYNFQWSNVYLSHDIPYLSDGYWKDSELQLYVTQTQRPYFNIYESNYFNEQSLHYWNQPDRLNLLSTVDSLGQGYQTLILGAPTEIITLTSDAIYDDSFYMNNGGELVGFYSSEAQNQLYRPQFTHYLSKFYQDQGYMFLQTDTHEHLSICSPQYSSNTLSSEDALIIDCKPFTSNEIKIQLFNEGEFVDEYTLIPQGNNDFTHRSISIQIPTQLTFDQLKICGYLDDTENIIIYDIKAQKESFGDLYSISSRYEFIEQNNPQYPQIIRGSTAYPTTPSMAHEDDGQIWIINSEFITQNTIEAEFLFEEIYGENLDDAIKFEIKLKGNSDLSLLEQIKYRYWDYIENNYRLITPILEDGYIILRFEYNDFYRLFDSASDSYVVRLFLQCNSQDSFSLSFDSVYSVVYKPWNGLHDMYRAEVQFSKLSPIQGQEGKICFSLNDNIYVYLDEEELTEKNTVSFYYNSSTYYWYAYHNNNPIEHFGDMGRLYDPTFHRLVPRIECFYDDPSEGIKITSLKSQYFKRIRDQNDFTDYKYLVSLCKRAVYTKYIDLDQYSSRLIGDNTFVDLTSQIDVIYSFADEMVPQNIFSYDLNPTYISNTYQDNITNFSYREDSLLLDHSDSLKFSYAVEMMDTYAIIQGDETDLYYPDGNLLSIQRETFDSKDNNSFRESIWEDFHVSYDGAPPILDTSFPSGDWSAEIDGISRYYHINKIWSWTRSYEKYRIPSNYLDYNEDMVISDIEIEFQNNIVWKYVDSASLAYFIYNHYTEEWDQIDHSYTPEETSPTCYRFNKISVFNKTHLIDSLLSHYISPEGNIDIMTKVYSNPNDKVIGHIVDYYCDMAHATLYYIPIESKVQFNFQNGLLNSERDFILYFKGSTLEGTANFIVNDNTLFSFGESGIQGSCFIYDVESISIDLGYWDDVWELEIDSLYIYDISTNITYYPINNKLIQINSDISKIYDNTDPPESSDNTKIKNNTFFGNNTIEFSLENSLITPIFKRESQTIYTDLELDDLEFIFNLYPSDFPSQTYNVWGSDAQRYNISELNYGLDRFKDSAIDNIQIPLITPIELKFDNLDLNIYDLAELEVSLGLNITIVNRKYNTDWLLRSRLVYYNYLTEEWQDFNGQIRAENNGINRAVWNYNYSSNPFYYIQSPDANCFIEIQNENPSLKLMNPFKIKGLTNDYLDNNQIMKLALISYILPSNYSANNNIYEAFKRVNPNLAIEISQQVNINECVMLLEKRQTIFPASTFAVELPIEDNFEVDLNGVDDPAIGEIVKVYGIRIEENTIEKYPVFNFLVTHNNKLSLEQCSQKELFTNVSIEYLPSLPLELFDGRWYIPNSSYYYSDPISISNLRDEANYYGDMIPNVPANYSIFKMSLEYV